MSLKPDTVLTVCGWTEKHLLETAGVDAPELCGILVPPLLNADDLILMSTSPEGLLTTTGCTSQLL